MLQLDFSSVQIIEYLRGAPFSNIYLNYLYQFFLLLFLFLVIKILSQNYLSIAINEMIKFFRIPKQLAAMTLVAFSNGLPDVIDGIQASGQHEAIGIGLGIYLGAFIFCSTMTLA